MSKQVNKKALSTDKNKELRLTAKSRKFIELIIKGAKIVEAHKAAGYSGNKDAAYALNKKLSPFIQQYYEVEGISRDSYKSRLLNLLSLPCVDRKGKVIDSLNFTQYKDLLLLLRDELDRQENKAGSHPKITAFVIQTHAQAMKANGTQGGEIIDVKGEDISPAPVNGK